MIISSCIIETQCLGINLTSIEAETSILCLYWSSQVVLYSYMKDPLWIFWTLCHLIVHLANIWPLTSATNMFYVYLPKFLTLSLMRHGIYIRFLVFWFSFLVILGCLPSLLSPWHFKQSIFHMVRRPCLNKNKISTSGVRYQMVCSDYHSSIIVVYLYDTWLLCCP